MIRINEISLPLDYDDETLKRLAAKKLGNKGFTLYICSIIL